MSNDYLEFIKALKNETKVMLNYAASSGLQMPAGAPVVVAEMEQALLRACEQYERGNGNAAGERDASGGNGAIDTALLEQLTQMHNKLVALIAPATPRGIMAIYPFKSDRNLLRRTFGNVNIAWKLMLAGVVFLLMFFFISLFEAVDGNPAHANPLTNCGFDLLLNEIFFLTAAGLGATFAALVQVNKYIRLGNFDQRYESSYWLQLMLGMIAGIVLAQLLSSVIYDDQWLVSGLAAENCAGTIFESAEGRASSAAEDLRGGEQQVSPPAQGGPAGPYYAALFALIGGFSSSLVYRLMTRFKEAIESMFQADLSEQVELREQQAKARMQNLVLQNSAKQLRQLLTLQQELARLGASQEIQEQLSKTIIACEANDVQV